MDKVSEDLIHMKMDIRVATELFVLGGTRKRIIFFTLRIENAACDEWRLGVFR